MGTVALREITKRFGSTVALRDVSFDVAEGEFFTIIGPTKAGKTTTLRTIAGLERPDAGDVLINNQRVTTLHPRRRKVSLLFQNIALFPHCTGFENIAFPLRVMGLPEEDVRRRVIDAAEMLRISHVLDRRPQTFSGGEQQRVAIGRAIIGPSEVTLLDEPLSNLDARIRLRLRNELKRLHRDLRRTFLYVTHDQVEAMTLSDRILVLHEGRIQQIGPPDEIYNRPRNRFVAEVIGSPPMNLIPGCVTRLAGGLAFVNESLRQDLSRFAERAARLERGEAMLGVRPEDVEVGTEEAKDRFQSEVCALEPLGSKTVIDIRCGSSNIRAVTDPSWGSPVGARVWARFRPSRLHLLDPGTGLFV
jgi:multiple sugar transport system ATP-binding protein